jgi:drug/metabolite transporter (DMT)-like permease
LKKYLAYFALLMVGIIWGFSFIVMKNVISYIAIFNLLGIRFIIAGLISAIIFHKQVLKMDLSTIKRGCLIGLFMFLGYVLQTFGLYYTTASKSGLITGFNVVLVPLLAPLFIKHTLKPLDIVAALIAFCGIGLLSISGPLHQINIGDILTLASSFMFAMQVIFISKYSKTSNNINSAIIQILFVGIASTLISLFMEDFTVVHYTHVWKDILFLAVFCTAFSFITQNSAQKYISASKTALILTIEPLSAAIFAYLLLEDVLGTRGILGAALVLAGMILSELKGQAAETS